MSDLPPAAHVMQVLMGVMNSAAVSATARLGILDHLHSGPKTVEELAHAVGAKPELLFRLMRATAGLGILAQTPDGKWEQTPMSDVLRSDAAETLRYFASRCSSYSRVSTDASSAMTGLSVRVDNLGSRPSWRANARSTTAATSAVLNFLCIRSLMDC